MENLSPEESLRVIQAMIDKTKTSVADKSFYFLLWGWLVLVGSLLQYFLFVIVKTPQHGAAWSIMFVGIIVSIVRGAKEKSGPVKTYVDEGLTSIWICLYIVQGRHADEYADNGRRDRDKLYHSRPPAPIGI
jgi:hypothetical protein